MSSSAENEDVLNVVNTAFTRVFSHFSSFSGKEEPLQQN